MRDMCGEKVCESLRQKERVRLRSVCTYFIHGVKGAVGKKKRRREGREQEVSMQCVIDIFVSFTSCLSQYVCGRVYVLQQYGHVPRVVSRSCTGQRASRFHCLRFP